jgi:hypothetical protein
VPWAAVWAIARSEWRRRRGSLAVAGVLTGLAVAAAGGALAVAARTSSAYERLVRATGAPDVSVVGLPPSALAEVRALPGVAQAWATPTIVGQLDIPGQTYLSLSIAPAGDDRIARPVVVRGREAGAGAADELVISEPTAAEFGLRVGDEIGLALLTRTEFAQFDVGFGRPDGPHLRLRVVGIARYPVWGGAGIGTLQASPALAPTIAEDALTLISVRCEPAARCAVVADRIRAMADAREYPGAASLAPTVELRAGPDPSVATGRRVGVAALMAFAAVAAAGMALVLGQAIARRQRLGAAQRAVESAFGLRRMDSALAQAAATLPAAGLAAAIAGGGCLLAGAIEPLGIVAGYEPSPGWLPSWPLSVLAAAVGAAAPPVLTLAFTAVRDLRRADATGAGRPLGRTSARPWMGPVRAQNGGGRGWLVAGGALAAATAVVTLALSAAELERRPGEWGWQADFAVLDVRPDQIAALRADPRAAAVAQLTDSRLTIVRPNGELWHVGGFGIAGVKGDAPIAVIAGRLPRADGEAALGPRVASELELAVGDRLAVLDTAGARRELAVTGIVATPPLSPGALGEQVATTTATVGRLSEAYPYETALVRAQPGRGPALLATWREQAEVIERSRPDAIEALARLGALPGTLVGVFGSVGVLALAHAVTAGSASRRRQLDVLRALGFTPGQLARGQLLSALSTAVKAAAVGIPVGIAAARALWWHIGGALGFEPRLAGSLAAAGAVFAAAVAAAIIVASPLAVRTGLSRRAGGTPTRPTRAD